MAVGFDAILELPPARCTRSQTASRHTCPPTEWLMPAKKNDPAKKEAGPKEKAAPKKKPAPEHKTASPRTPPPSRKKQPHPKTPSESSESSSEAEPSSSSSSSGSDSDPYRPTKKRRTSPSRALGGRTGTPEKKPAPEQKPTPPQTPPPATKPRPPEPSAEPDFNRPAKRRCPRRGVGGDGDGSPKWDPSMPASPTMAPAPVSQAAATGPSVKERKRAADHSDSDSDSDEEDSSSPPSETSAVGEKLVWAEAVNSDAVRIPGWEQEDQDTYGPLATRGLTYCEDCFEAVCKRYFRGRRREQVQVDGSEFNRTLVATLAKINDEAPRGTSTALVFDHALACAAASNLTALSADEAEFVAAELAAWDANVIRYQIASQHCEHEVAVPPEVAPEERATEQCPGNQFATPRCTSCGRVFFPHAAKTTTSAGSPEPETPTQRQTDGCFADGLGFPTCFKERGVCFDVDPCADWPMVVSMGVDATVKLPDTPLYILNRLAVWRNRTAQRTFGGICLEVTG